MKTLLRLSLIVLGFTPFFSFSQKTHTVGPKETLFSIGREYQVHPRELAEFNNIPFETSLTIGQVLKIPSKKTMQPVSTATAVKTEVTSSPNKEKNSQFTAEKTNNVRYTPIYHIVKKQENLFQIRMQYNKVPMDSLKKWNNLSSDAVNEGMNLIVGYKKINDNNSVEKVTATEQDNNKKTNVPAKKEQDFFSKRASDFEKDNSISYEEDFQEKIKKTPSVPEGFFKTAFENQSSSKTSLKEEIGKLASFKSTSGWDDSKYYCLYNNAPAGVIVRITHVKNQKVIYAKVLDTMPDLEQNKGITIRLSRAGAEQLDATNDKFEVNIAY